MLVLFFQMFWLECPDNMLSILVDERILDEA